jgi:hypothetical protein
MSLEALPGHFSLHFSDHSKKKKAIGHGNDSDSGNDGHGEGIAGCWAIVRLTYYTRIPRRTGY